MNMNKKYYFVLYCLALTCFIQNCVLIATATDNNDGTLDLLQPPFGIHLTVAKCSQVDTSGNNMYNAASNDCSNGTAGTFQYCTSNSIGCLDLKSDTTRNGADSEAYQTCANLTLADRKWRVPDRTTGELDDIYYVYSHDKSLFPGTIATPNSFYWTSRAYAPYNYTVLGAYALSFYNGDERTPDTTVHNYVRCVSGGVKRK